MLKGAPTATDSEWIKQCNVVVSTVAAIQILPAAELGALLAHFDQIYFDEAHHLPSDSWKRINDLAAEKKVLQFTATPFRLDGQRIQGKIIFNFPLRIAQKQGYFRKIRFIDVFEPDPDVGHASIAERAVEQLRKDRANGLNHLVLARAETTASAEAIYETYYKKYTDLNPTVIHSKTRGHHQLLQEIKEGKHQVVVCVDMFGEGFDLPALKIAALHEPHRSLAISLQFTGRFTRDAKGIGDPTVIANTADIRVSDAIEDLYAEDADWNSLIPNLSAKAIQSQEDFSEFLERMDNKLEIDEDIFSLNVLRPKVSTVIYHADRFNPAHFKRWTKSTHVERHWISKDKDLVIFITKTRNPIEWATIKDTSNENWNLFIAAYEADQKLLFIHSSQKGSLYPELAKAVSGPKVSLLEGEQMFRAFHGLNRLIFYNAGLYNRGSKLRFRMYTGLDIAEEIQPSTQTNSTKSNLFGVGYENGDQISVGVSYKGRVWSMTSGSVPDWRQWCRNVAKKIQDTTIPTDGYLKHTLRPREIAQLPSKEILLMTLPVAWYGSEADAMRLYRGGAEITPHAFEIKGYTVKNRNTIDLEVGWDENTGATFSLEWGAKEGQFQVKQSIGDQIEIRVEGVRRPLAEYFAENPPTIYFLDGSEAEGGFLRESPGELKSLFDPAGIVEFDWAGVDIKDESKWKHGQKRPTSVQGRMIEYLVKEPNQLVFDDDDSGEAADIVEINEDKQTVVFRLYHCKYAGGAKPGGRVKDPAEVGMQAVRSVRWRDNPKRLVEHLMYRQINVLNGRPTRLEKGTIRWLAGLKRRLRKLNSKFEIFVVQPGISKAAFSPELSTMLGAASNLIHEMTGKTLKVIASK